MEQWLASVYSDGTAGFVSDPLPGLGETVTVSLRFLSKAPVKQVFLWRMINGAESYTEMRFAREEKGLVWYEAELKMNQPRVPYHFVLVCEEVLYFYTQEGILTYVPDYLHDFVLLADFPQPDWVKGAVFYQIFPERFCNGDPSLDVQDGEYDYHGRSPVRITDWNADPLPLEQSHGMDFFGGDLYGIIQKIPYLKELGVTAIYLNPVFTSYSSHKYDCNDYFHVDPHFGGDEALAALSNALHENDMRLILDISINHTGIEHTWVKEGKPFYFKKEDGSLMGWWGVETLPVLDYRSEELRDLIYRGEGAVLRKWLRPPYSIDGWRFDVADVLARNDDVQLADEIWPEVCRAIREENPEAFIIGEHWADCGEYLQGGLWNTPMNYFGYGRIIRQFVGLPDLFLERNEAFQKVSYPMTAQDVVRRTQEHYSKLPQVIQDAQMNLFDSHDVARVHNFEKISFDQWKAVVVSQLLWTGIPCVYYGDELGIDGYVENDAGFRFPMPWERETNDKDACYEIYHKVISLRRQVPAFREGGRKVLCAEGRVLAVARFLNDEVYIGVISMENEEKQLGLPLYLLGVQELENDTDVFGKALISEVDGGGNCTLTVPAGSALVFRCI